MTERSIGDSPTDYKIEKLTEMWAFLIYGIGKDTFGMLTQNASGGVLKGIEMEIKPLSKELKEDYLHLFDTMVHEENPDWSICYCNDYHFLGDVETCTRDLSRAMIIDRIYESELQGYLVFENNKPVGWCNANNRQNYQRLLRDYDLVDNLDDKVCSVVCFLIHPNFRRQGISGKLLERVIEDCSNKDYDFIEAYPRKGASNESNFKGPLELYKRYGFKEHKEHEGFYVMRRYLRQLRAETSPSGY